MSHAKRVRKARMKARQAKRREATWKQFEDARAFHEDAVDRARFRKELNAIDMPDAVKTVVGMLVDPIGFAVEELRKHADKIVQQEDRK